MRKISAYRAPMVLQAGALSASQQRAPESLAGDGPGMVAPPMGNREDRDRWLNPETRGPIEPGGVDAPDRLLDLRYMRVSTGRIVPRPEASARPARATAVRIDAGEFPASLFA